jgi:hypothetical protein
VQIMRVHAQTLPTARRRLHWKVARKVSCSFGLARGWGLRRRAGQTAVSARTAGTLPAPPISESLSVEICEVAGARRGHAGPIDNVRQGRAAKGRCHARVASLAHLGSCKNSLFDVVGLHRLHVIIAPTRRVRPEHVNASQGARHDTSLLGRGRDCPRDKLGRIQGHGVDGHLAMGDHHALLGYGWRRVWRRLFGKRRMMEIRAGSGKVQAARVAREHLHWRAVCVLFVDLRRQRSAVGVARGGDAWVLCGHLQREPMAQEVCSSRSARVGRRNTVVILRDVDAFFDLGRGR